MTELDLIETSCVQKMQEVGNAINPTAAPQMMGLSLSPSLGSEDWLKVSYERLLRSGGELVNPLGMRILLNSINAFENEDLSEKRKREIIRDAQEVIADIEANLMGQGPQILEGQQALEQMEYVRKMREKAGYPDPLIAPREEPQDDKSFVEEYGFWVVGGVVAALLIAVSRR